MPIMERDVVLTGKENGTHTIDLPITALKNVEDTADVKAKPAEGDYIPLMDSTDNMQMKKVLVSALKELFSIVVDAELSAASENPVQNKVLEAALKLKAAASHMHSAGDINSGVLPAARGGTGTTSIAGLTQAIATALTGSADLAGQLSAAMGACKIQTGSYTGTGTYGSANPCSLTFDFVPKFLYVRPAENSPMNVNDEWIWTGEISRIVSRTFCWDLAGTTMKWWYDNFGSDYSDRQLNSTSKEYFWIALG